MSRNVESAAELLDQVAGECAVMRAWFGRNVHDDFEFTTTLGNTAFGTPSTNDVKKLLPEGSRWSSLSGFRSFGGQPMSSSGKTWYVLYARDIVLHSDRGAFPTQLTVVLPNESDRVAEVLQTLLSLLAPPCKKCVGEVEYSGFVVREVDEPPQYLQVESAVISAASSSAQSGTLIPFTSLAFADRDIPPFKLGSLFKRGNLGGRMAIGLRSEQIHELSAKNRKLIHLHRFR